MATKAGMNTYAKVVSLLDQRQDHVIITKYVQCVHIDPGLAFSRVEYATAQNPKSSMHLGAGLFKRRTKNILRTDSTKNLFSYMLMILSMLISNPTKVLAESQDKTQAMLNHRLEFANSNKPTDNEIQLTEEERAWIVKHPILRVGFDPFWAPIEFLSDAGMPQGISIQYLQRMEETLRVKFEFVKGLSWPNAYKKLMKSELDILPAISATTERRKHANFTTSYLSIPIGIFSAVNRAYLGGLEALRDKRVIVVEGHAIQSWLEKEHPELKLITAPTLKEALREVAQERAFALVGNLVSTSFYIGQSGLNQIKVVGETDYNYKLSIAVRKDWQLLPGILEKAINAIPQSERIAIYNDWISMQYKPSRDYSMLWQLLAGVALLVVMISYWYIRLARETSKRHKMETALIRSKQEANKAALEAEIKTDFLARMSHEIRIPINAIVGIGHLLSQTELTKQQREYLEKMTCSSEAILDIIGDILDFSKAEATMLTLDNITFNLEQILRNAKQIFVTQAAQKDLELTMRIAPNVPDMLIGDPKKLSQILRNLISNAIKFTEQGEINIVVDLLEQYTTNTMLRFTVKDTGAGITSEMQKKLFQPYSQGDSSITRKYGGTGLGLAISQQLARLMGSDITINSKPGEGSTFSFTVTFDVCESQTQIKSIASKEPALITPHPQLANIKVLLVEDDDINQFFEKKFLQAFGTQVKIAANSKKAIQMLLHETFDIVLMDIQMPEMDGFETTRVIRREEKWRMLPIIAFTAHTISSERDKCLAAGMSDYVSKPFEPIQLRDMLLKWCTCNQKEI